MQLRSQTFGRSCQFADKTEISDEDVDLLRRAIKRHSVFLRLNVGDALVLDNRVLLHGRMPFVGERKLFTVMGGPLLGDIKD
jgi:alpha-ketoglutarate-dependent taurine dioxygenase